MNKKNPKLTYKKVFQFPQDTHDFIEGLMKGKTLHCCCGNSLLGDVRIDIEKQPDQDIKEGFIQGDIFEVLEGKNYSQYDTVICDPLWHLPYQKRPGLAFLLRDQVKLGGRLILNALWIPTIKTMELREIYVGKNSMAWRNVSLIMVYEKTEEGNSETILKEKEVAKKEKRVK
ncbi:MAG TPA: hypothetical protein EYN67_02435 [Flavobacteriales bacterium]|nr:hypothetical protein [Flavobacteriales bacterium]